MNAKRIALLCIWLSLLVIEKTLCCTIIYGAKEGIILAGNNEDWKDPLTKMWIYPPTGAKHGWIKFGFGSGFPQGGMNDQGVFWDATAGPHKEMPLSEENKTFYDRVLMQKVIEESSNVAEAKEILQNFYSQDQYRAQYLIGDALGSSMIAEGDSFLMLHGDFQVLTNFYQSDPDLGGYPCWRYQTATELLAGCDTFTPYFIGTVLASTHQEGQYPTQYSNIYDLKNKRVYLFYFHHYEEFLVIDLLDEMEKGIQSYDIPSIFSQITLLSPGNRDTIVGNEATISWTGLPGCTYRIIYAKNPDLSEPVSVEAPLVSGYQKNNASVAILVPLVLMLLLISSKRNRAGIVLSIFVIMAMGIQCERDKEPDGPEIVIEQSVLLHNLEPATIYYWKMEATNSTSGSFTTETVVRSFQTSSQ